ncbi:MAG: carbohydrate binding family 9 domain-containing protein [Chitinophagaceae bacterium]|nr:carbohydrate binding family 9 domain-containing protein [Chitinophagaceae bacterium]
MKCFSIKALCFCMLLTSTAYSQTAKRQLPAKRINTTIKIDGVLQDAAWKDASLADKFIALRPTPFIPETAGNATQVYFLYDNDGIYVGGYLHEKNKDSIAAELKGRDGFGNNDFIGVIFDTYYDKLNGFEYFVTPLGEQWDAKVSPNTNGNSEDFSWNAVWESAAKMQHDGWSFEMFIPYSAIRFGKKNVQDWGLNIVRRRQKSGEQLFWQSIDPNANGFLTQEGSFTGLENIKPPMRLQFSPYFSTYLNHDGTAAAGVKKSSATVNGGMDVKYGINQAFTLDMTLIPDFGQVQSDNRILNLTPFEQKFNENRAFFTEGTELFGKGNLFYSRRIGIEPRFKKWLTPGVDETIIEDPGQAKIINATKISGRTQKGLGVGILNAITQKQYTKFQDINTKQTRLGENMPLTNYNILVLDQTLKNNSSVSLVNTNVWRSGKDYDANVTSALFDLNDKKNKWNIGGNISFSNLLGKNGKNTTGYAHSIYFAKTSGRFTFNVWQDLYNSKYDKSDFGYFTNNNTMDQGVWAGYNWVKPRGWYNQVRLNANIWYSRLVTPIDNLRRTEMMYQNASMNINFNAQTKKLWWVGMNINGGPGRNDFYEPRKYGRVFRDKGRVNANIWWESNFAKKLSWGGSLYAGTGGVFNRKNVDYNLFGKIRFSSKFSVDNSIYVSSSKNQAGWAGSIGDTIIFSRRNVNSVENVINIKYNFTNRMGLTLRARHYWSKVNPQQFYELDVNGKLQTPVNPFTGNVNQNYNYLSVDMVYNWQFAQGSFLSIVWKDIGESFNRQFEKNYVKNLGNTISGDQFNSLSLRVIYFLDYLTVRKKFSKS